MAGLRFSDEREAGAIADLGVEVADDGYISGWATTVDPGTWAYLGCYDEKGFALTYEIANRFSRYAFENRLGYGWVGFQIDLTRCWPAVRGKIVEFFCVKSGDKVFDYAAPDVDLSEAVQNRLAQLNVRQFVMELKARREQVDVAALELYVTAFVVKYGLGEYIRRAYHYILQRGVVNEEMIYYAGMMEKGVAPLGLWLSS